MFLQPRPARHNCGFRDGQRHRPPRIFWLKALAGALCLMAWTASPSRADAPKVVASIGPVHSLVAGVMDGAGVPFLLVPGNASPHTFALKPSDARALSQADIVFWIGEGLEGFLAKPLNSLAKGSRVVELADAPGVFLLERRKGGAWPEHRHTGKADNDHDKGRDQEKAAEKHGHDDNHESKDAHLWLDPANGRAIVAAAVAALSDKDPADAARYRRNGEILIQRLKALETELAAKLAPVANRPFVVFHDGYQYFEKRFGLNAVGAVTVDPERPPGARALKALRARIAGAKAACVFSEPQFEPRLVRTVSEGTGARAGTLDPLGAALSPGPGLYSALLENLTDSLVRCLGGGGT